MVDRDGERARGAKKGDEMMGGGKKNVVVPSRIDGARGDRDGELDDVDFRDAGFHGENHRDCDYRDADFRDEELHDVDFHDDHDANYVHENCDHGANCARENRYYSNSKLCY